MITQLLTCPRCSRKDITVLLDNDGDPYICDECWNEDGGETCETCRDFIAGGNPFSRYCDTCLDARQLTNSSIDPNYYRIKFANLPYDHWEYGNTAIQAIATARHDLIESGNATGELGNATARQAVYKEWNNHTWQYTNGNGFIRRDQTPCDNCKTPISTETHREELGLCVTCSNDYLNHTCDNCEAEEVHNIIGPFTRLCDQCQE